MALAAAVVTTGVLCAVLVGSGGTSLATATGFAALTAKGVTIAKAGAALGLVGFSCLLLGWRRADAGGNPTDQTPK